MLTLYLQSLLHVQQRFVCLVFLCALFFGFADAADDVHVGSYNNITDYTENNETTAVVKHFNSSKIITFNPLDWFEKPIKNEVNLAFLPSFAFILFILMVCLRAFVWHREDQKFKRRGCSYDITSYVILTQGDENFRNVEFKSDTASNYDTVNSVSSFFRRGAPMYDTIHSTSSLQNRIDAKIYETVTSYTSILKKAQQVPDNEIQVASTGKKSRKTSSPNSYTINLEDKSIKIKDTRFRVVPALDNHMKNVNMKTVRQGSFKSSDGSSKETIQNRSELSLNTDKNSVYSLPKSETSNNRRKRPIMIDAETQVNSLSRKRTLSQMKAQPKERLKQRSYSESDSKASKADPCKVQKNVLLKELVKKTNLSDAVALNGCIIPNPTDNFSQNKLVENGDDFQDHDFSKENDMPTSCQYVDNKNTESYKTASNVFYVTAVVHNEINNSGRNHDGYFPNMELINEIPSKFKKSDIVKLNGVAKKQSLQHSLSESAINSNVFDQSKNCAHEIQNTACLRHHRNHSWNIGYRDGKDDPCCHCNSNDSNSDWLECSICGSNKSTVSYKQAIHDIILPDTELNGKDIALSSESIKHTQSGIPTGSNNSTLLVYDSRNSLDLEIDV